MKSVDNRLYAVQYSVIVSKEKKSHEGALHLTSKKKCRRMPSVSGGLAEYWASAQKTREVGGAQNSHQLAVSQTLLQDEHSNHLAVSSQ